MMEQMPNYVPGEGPNNPRLMFVGEAPGRSEDFTKTPFVERDGEYSAGSLLSEICREINLDRREVYITNVVKWRPPDNKLKRLGEIGITIDSQVNQLWEEVNAIKPNCIVTFGNLPLKAIFGKGNGSKGILHWRGSYLPTLHMEYKGVPTIHPAALLHGEGELDDEDLPKGKKKGAIKYAYKQIIKLDLLKALKHSEDKLYNPPKRLLEICRDHIQLQRFLEQYKDKTIVSVDIEVTKAIPFCIALAFNEWHSLSIPLLNCFAWTGDEASGIQIHTLAEMWSVLARFLDGPIRVIGQNFKFDQRQLARICGIYIRNFYCDTSLLAHSLHPEFPKSLEFTTSVYTDEPYYKNEGKEFDSRKDNIERYLTYNARDAAVTFEVFTEMMKDAHELKVKGFPNWVDEFILGHVMPFHNFYYDLEDVGFAVDRKRQIELSKEYGGRIKEAQEELEILTGHPFNVHSNPTVAKVLYEELKFPLRKGAGEEVIYSLMANHTSRRPVQHKRILELILLIRRLSLNHKKIFKAKPDYDGRMRTQYTIAGTETGRSNTKVLKPPVRPEQIGVPLQLLTKHGDVGLEAREFLIADPGYVIVETDMSQAEARIVALLGNDEKLLKLFNEGADIHTLTASWIFGVPPDQITRELRFIGKTARHAGNYDMQKKRAAELINTDAKKYGINISISEWKADIILKKFHAFSPNIRGVFHAEIREALERDSRTLINPFGRYRQFYDRWGRELWKESYAQIPQSTVPDHLRLAGIRSKTKFRETRIDARFVVESHDALTAIVRENQVTEYRRIVHEEIERPINFSRCSISRGSLIIPAETKVGWTYRECEAKKCNNPNCRNLHSFSRYLQTAA